MHCFLHQGPILLLSPWAIMRSPPCYYDLPPCFDFFPILFRWRDSSSGFKLCHPGSLLPHGTRFHISSRIVVRGFLYKSPWPCCRPLLPFHSHFTPLAFPRRWVKGRNFLGIQRMKDVQKYLKPWACLPTLLKGKWSLSIAGRAFRSSRNACNKQTYLSIFRQTSLYRLCHT